MRDTDDEVIALTQRSTLWSRAAILAEPCPVPRSAGVYGWFFKEIPPGVPIAGCAQRQGFTLLYVGISPQKQAPGKKPSAARIQSRICYHMGRSGKENAEGSTLRMSLGCLLSQTLGIRLRQLGKSFTFGPGEVALSDWLECNARVSWVLHPQPWLLEDRLIADCELPLNLKGNSRNPFYLPLKKIRKDAKAAARVA
jgi:GIY-YIG catalytic domain